MLNKEKILGGVYGLAIGDALGVPVEFCKREILDQAPVKDMEAGGTHKQDKGTWSDDTSMVLATMDAMSAGGLSYGMIMDNFKKWFTQARYTATGLVFDIGGTTSAAIHSYMRGELIDRCGLDDERSNGNGSLMRILPMIYYVAPKYGMEVNPVVVEQVGKVSSLTHAHEDSKRCCVYYVYIGMYVMEYGGNGIQRAIRKAIEAVDLYYHVRKEDSLLECVNLTREGIESTGYVWHSLISAIWCLWNSSSYEEAVLRAVNLGGDTDTIGAITGGLAGLYYGYGAIPKEWIKDLKNKELINSICNRFYEQYK